MFYSYWGRDNHRLLTTILKELRQMANQLRQLQADVEEQTTVVASTVTLLQGLKTALDAAIASNDPAALAALSASLESNTKALSEAVAANTPSE